MPAMSMTLQIGWTQPSTPTGSPESHCLTIGGRCKVKRRRLEELGGASPSSFCCLKEDLISSCHHIKERGQSLRSLVCYS